MTIVGILGGLQVVYGMMPEDVPLSRSTSLMKYLPKVQLK